jgi:hypothetical protein
MSNLLDAGCGRRRAAWTAALGAVLLAAGLAWIFLPRTAPRRAAAASVRVAREATIRQELFSEIQPVKVANCDLQRFGEAHDGGYLLCANLLGDAKAAYSYGISGYDGWGCDISRRPHVAVHQYDCFNLTEPTCPDGTTIFHGECVGTTRSVQDGHPFDTLANQFAKNRDAARPLVMKMDVEGAEWDTFLFAPDSVFDQLDQLDVEFHHVDEEKFVAVMRRLKGFFNIAHVHYNNFSCDPGLRPFPSWAFEVLLVSKRIAPSDGSPPAAGPIAPDAPNNPESADCQAAPTSQGTL